MAKQRVRLNDPAPAPAPVKRKRVRLDTESITTPFAPYTSPYPAHKGDKPTACSKCKHIYWRPCNGKRKTCLNTVAGSVRPHKKRVRAR